MDGYRSAEWHRKSMETSISNMEEELRKSDSMIEEYREKCGDGIGIRIYEKQRDLEMTLYLYALDKRYNLREIIREARKRPEMAYIFDDPDDE